jgi:EpsD family peptidyl-prolyl cis-trans isomerase
MVMKIFLPALITVALALSSCGKGDVKQSAGQVAAKVNGEEISLHRVNNAIARDNESSPEHIKQTAAQVLERVIDEEVLVQSAVKARLDRDPQVMQAIEESKRQILARAYIERAVSPGSTESREEIETFYSENPALFERRRIYRVHDLVVTAPREKLDALKAAASGVKSINDVTEWLKSEKLPFQVEISSRPAEQIPLNILPELSKMREGQISVFPTPRGGSVVQLLQSAEAPIGKQQATPLIERYLLSRKRIEAARAEVKKLREQAKIEYVGEFDAARAAARAQPASTKAGEKGGVNVHGQIENSLAGLR